MQVNSISGKLDTADFGLTLMHEHFINVEMSLVKAFDDWLDEEAAYTHFADEVAKAKKYGVKTMVEATPITLGRDIHLIAEAAKRADIQMLCCTGLYSAEEPWFDMGVDPEYLANHYLRDIQDGIQGTSIKAAFVKVATDNLKGFSEANQGMLKAAVIASQQSGVPIYTHSNCTGHLGLVQQQALLEQGVPPHKIVIGHVFDSMEEDYVETLLKNGTYVGCDRLGIDFLVKTEDVADFLAGICLKGYSKQIMLSHDASVRNDFGLGMTPLAKDYDNYPTCIGFTAIFERVIPRLKEHGVTQEMIDDMMIHNPRRYFEGAPIA